MHIGDISKDVWDVREKDGVVSFKSERRINERACDATLFGKEHVCVDILPVSYDDFGRTYAHVMRDASDEKNAHQWAR